MDYNAKEDGGLIIGVKTVSIAHIARGIEMLLCGDYNCGEITGGCPSCGEIDYQKNIIPDGPTSDKMYYKCKCNKCKKKWKEYDDGKWDD